MSKIVSKNAEYPNILFFYQGDEEIGAAFFDGVFPNARAISDMPKDFYSAFGIERGGMKQMFGAPVWACGTRASAKGHAIGKPVGDPWVMPGLFLVEGGNILWNHDFAHAGDHPDWEKIPQFV